MRSYPKSKPSFYRSSHPEVFLGKEVPKICSKFTGQHLCGSVISIKFQRATSKTWTRTLTPGPWTQTLDPGPRLWTMDLDPEKPGL